MSHDEHERWMRRCLELAGQGAGLVSPNPMVGSVLVGPDGLLLGEGWHRAYGGPHAERWAVRDAEERHGRDVFRDATLYVNLEPCNHHGKTPPCTDIILEMEIRRVVVGMVDPFPKVAGSGIARLRENGVEVVTGILEAECLRLNEAFIHHVRTGRPLVTLKMAQTLDGRIATSSGDSRWVSGLASQQLVHFWRTQLDGVIVGTGTARADDPALTVRHVEGRQPVRVVPDREGSLSSGLQVFNDPFVADTVVVTAPGVRPDYAGRLLENGGRILEANVERGQFVLKSVLERLGAEGGRNGMPMQSVLVEGGPHLASSLVREDLADRIYVFVAPKLVGSGLAVLDVPGVNRMADALTFAEASWEPVGQDVLFRGYRRPVTSS